MKTRSLFFLCVAFYSSSLMGQNVENSPLPDRFKDLPEKLLVNHFPSPVYATTDSRRKDFSYFWKHTTSVMSPSETVKLVECGAYIFYNDQWNLRISYTNKDFSKIFECPAGMLVAGQPYTFPDNWRTDNRLFGGWAMWYFIAENEAGEQCYGVGKLETIGALMSK